MRFLKALVFWLFFLAFLAGAGAAAGWVWFNNELTRPGPLAHETVFKVEPGEALAVVAERLETEGIIHDARLLRLKARIDGTELAVKSGEYIIEPAATLGHVLSILIEGRSVLHRITLPEGRTTAQLLRVIEKDEILTGDMPEVLPEEGTMLPDTYMYHRGMTRQELIAKTQKAQADLLEELWPARQEGLPVSTPQEAVILASVVEKETGRVDERPQVAALFVTRLKRGMRLQSDPTIIYGISKGEPLYNKAGQRRTLYRSEIDRHTEWNTYQVDGLPKTPICNPGADAIRAVLNPPATEYIFFVADGKGGHLFAKTNAEHERNVAAYRAYERGEIQRERAN
ncbi:MAG: endolytic transglycosylase MltG [Hyphomonas sp.]|uniref:endolytic transglycosylase MltG n=1 Tax=Hyphomonas sp. TaxID=87 RepID=UPI00185C1A57|nr:endolytic transglycosylase MltG [Hyphomonas sp.]MBA3070020.1 endolytic transglycosylase MltG [Hyphomonas sp.]MBU3920657.1 endolytic transglycosylase MltG [Alphaproteobacteria bacterium]MBU4060404.1 endolytic transglycosylase MltG [Alphaproteobacteria bacterium]MBU4163072.1 endolytic transglycosylase MltG [Alphaproteobacteria bacterium]